MKRNTVSYQARQFLMFAAGLIFTAIAWWRHRANIVRLMNGTENRFDRKKKK